MRIKDAMSTDVATLQATDSLAKAREVMETKRIRQIPVVDGEGRVVGIISKRDIYAASVSNLTEHYERSKNLLEGRLEVAQIMTKEVETVEADEPLAAAAIKLQEMRIGALPVIENGKLVGIISSSDFLGIAVMLLER
ncbi:CBS domain-containing protein [Litoribrevibacter albus]|uniref:Acetoin utilization protein AcuB n=1 Tax=Litoribrevibacter albus TaxID=1473156 RepID=A0AA37SB64_9GAMM|nr:CBS domain-containing protein [Litoribrevibacter albus]GLQ32737.1 acetoin utilization protein AcuB [Litoribrevibacter albus]